LATLLASHEAAWAWVLLGMTLAVRVTLAYVAAVVVLDDSQFLRDIWLLPLRDLIAPIVWVASFMGNRIHWRGDSFTLKDGRLTRTSD
jgi:ceramide glucosyltransferase